MFVLENVPLTAYSTMRLGGTAAYVAEAIKRQDVSEAVAWADERGLPIIIIGEGSNLIWDDDGYPGLVLVNKIPGIEITGEFEKTKYLTAGGGVNWDSFVEHTVSLGLTGIEYLSLVPGTVGATPIQNVGAYGAEVSATIATLEAYDTVEKKYLNLRGSECGFSYRSSRFKTNDKGRFLITAVTFLLQQDTPKPPFYAALQTYLTEKNIIEITPQTIRDAVIAIRSSKLPDPKFIPNTGSFFANPIIPYAVFSGLQLQYDSLPHWNVEGGVKISAAWLIEQAGFKDFHDAETGMATWSKQPLVLVNERAETTAQLKAFKQKIVTAVQEKFGITLVQEPELV
jgi:UDP-N-acetylmuramate dehydrogenase